MNERATKITHKNSKQHIRGMTLIEIILVIALLGMVMTFIGGKVINKFRGGQKKVTLIYLNEVKSAMEEYQLDCNTYPKKIDDLVENPGDCPAFRTGGYLSKKQLKDPYGCDPVYENDGTNIHLKSLGKECKGGDGTIELEDQ